MNLLVVTLDTTRADLLSCYGGDPRTSPGIDRLAAQGVRFANAYSATNVTKPAHVSILTGQRSIEHRVFNNQVLIPDGTQALPGHMKRAGYRTAGFVAAVQLGERTGWEGFDVIEGPPKGRAQRPGKEVVDRALAWLRAGADDERPFFLWTHFFDPHTLYTPPRALAERYYDGDPRAGTGPPIGDAEWFRTWEYAPMHEWVAGVRDEEFARAMYKAEMESTDRQVQRLLGWIERRGLADSTVVVLTADHGESFGEHGVWYDHAGLYEPSIRIPLVIRVPGLPAGRVVDELVTQLDVLPTLSDLFGLGVRTRRSPSGGRSLRPLLEGESSAAFEPRDFLLFESAHNHHVAVRRGRWKYIRPVFESHRFFGTEPELYDLEADPLELANVIDEHPDVAAELAPLVRPWVEMGSIRKGELPTMDADVLQSLDDLGYAGGDD